MKLAPWLAIAIALISISPALADETSEPLTTIAFGSCARQNKPQPIWEAILAADPDVFLFLGDNVYSEAADITALKRDYAELAAKPGYRKLTSRVPVLATWDDHDYGRNDAGAELETKAEAQRVFLDFFGEPADSRRRTTPGVYDAKVFGPKGKRVQIILLDTRYFRSALQKGSAQPGPYVPNDDAGATILGEVQWEWLAKQLEQPAELRVIASSIQVIPDEHGFEKWGNFPAERQRLFDLIENSHADGVLFISGDRHFAELSQLKTRSYPLLDLTSSSLNHPYGFSTEHNSYRIGTAFRGSNFGLIRIRWSEPDPVVTLQIRDVHGKVTLSYPFPLSRLHHARPTAEHR